MKSKKVVLFVVLMIGSLLLGKYQITNAKELNILAAKREDGSIKVLTPFAVYPAIIPAIKGEKSPKHKITIPKISNFLSR